MQPFGAEEQQPFALSGAYCCLVCFSDSASVCGVQEPEHIVLVGTAHVSQKSADAVTEVIQVRLAVLVVCDQGCYCQDSLAGELQVLPDPLGACMSGWSACS